MTAVLITGATGKQGGSLIKSLISRNAPFEILAVTRNPTSTSAQKLRNLSPSIKLVEGDLENPAKVFQNAQRLTPSPIWGVYSVQAAIGNNSEEMQGKSLIDRSKNTSMEWTILRPTAFYENLAPDFFGKVFATCFKMALKGKKLQMVATSDIGHFGADAFLNPDQYKGRGVSLAGDEPSFEEMERVFVQKRRESLPMAFRTVCSLFMVMMKGMGYMFRWFYEEEYGADVKALKEVHPDMKDFGTWLDMESGFVKR
ncbi:nmrA-like family protein [Aspergillus pseudocaelatus]|uniref:NmrA-like family protein n=1 Tax=Aspergillus pseudocaelatus TaxID=1825620 RepID=A0ABQ6WQA3_9EURO|nr:nmrA-like family protein [Aspergillus pseudocaelatus]